MFLLCFWRRLGETGSSSGGGERGVADVFVDGFWWLNTLGASALNGVSVGAWSVMACLPLLRVLFPLALA
jgi:hypothetical protein